MIRGQVSKEALILLFLLFALAIAVLLKQLQKRYSFISYTPTLFLVSVGLGYFYEYQGIVGVAISQISSIDPRGILIIFLPPLIFQSAFNSDWHIFRKQSTQIFILAFPAVLVSAIIIMFCVKVVIGYDDSYYNYPEAFLFGSVLSCTDTVAVLALLKEAGAPKKFNSLIEGQSLFNDGTCMVLITISLELIKGTAPPPLQICVLFLQLTIGGITLGVLFGVISTMMIELVKNDAVLTVNITLGSCYLLYFTAEYVNIGIRVSGIMGLVSMGLYLAAFGRTKIPAQTREKVHRFWKIVIFITETIIFIIGGVIVGTKVLNNHEMKVIGQSEILKLISLYFCMTFARFFAIAIFMPKLKSQGYGLKWNQVFVLTYGGLRGAVGIAFTLIIAADPSLDKKFTFICLFNMAGCSIMTLIINANTAGFVIVKVGLSVKSDTKTRLYIKFLKQCFKDLKDRIEDLKKNAYLQNADWRKVQEKAGLLELEKRIQKTEQKIMKRSQSRSTVEMKSLQVGFLDDHLLGESDHSLMMQLRNRFCIVLKGIVWQKFQKNQCSSQSVRVLNQCVDFDLDSIDEPINSWEYITNHVHNKYFFPICFYLKKFHFFGNFADSMIFDRAGFIYDVVSTYLQAMNEAEIKSKEFPFDEASLNQLKWQSQQNRKRAISYLEKQIKISYPEIMKRIQTAKAAQSILNFQKIHIKEARKHGQLGEEFYKVLKITIQKNTSKVDGQSSRGQNMTDIQKLMHNQFFRNLNQTEIKSLLSKKIDLNLQKDQPLIKQYQKIKYLYFITRGQVNEQCRINGQSLVSNITEFKQSRRIYEFVGVNSILLGTRRNLEHCATANSIVSLFCFPLQDIKGLMITNLNVEGILYKEVLPCCSRVDQNYEKIKITSEILQRIRNFLSFRVCDSKRDDIIEGKDVIIVQGQIEKDNQRFKRGFFQIKQGDSATIHGPAKYFILEKGYSLNQRISKIRQSSMLRANQNQNRADTLIERAMYK